MSASSEGSSEIEPEDPLLNPPGRAWGLPSTLGGALYIVILSITSLALVVAALGPWRTGVRWFAGALITAAVVRAVLPVRDAGMLAVRSRWLDVTLLTIAGGALWFLAGSIPDA